jgi:P27 family predicted phage terminase small subunit
MRGRKPKNRPAPRLLPGAPKAPTDLDQRGLVEWRRISSLMEKRGTLSEEFGPAMLLYCNFYSIWAKAKDEIRKKGLVYKANGLLKTHPAIKIVQQLAPALRSLLSDLCLTPASRSRLTHAGPKEDADPFDDLLARSGGE